MNDVLRRLLSFAPLSLFASYAFAHGAPTDDRWVGAFKLGAVAALVQIALFAWLRWTGSRLILGANLWLLVAGAAAFARLWWVLRGYGVLAESGIFVAMLAVGVVATFATRGGFVGVASAAPAEVRRASWIMLAATAGAVAMAVAFRGDRTWAAAMPVIALAVLQRTLASRLRREPVPVDSARRVAVSLVTTILLAVLTPGPAVSQPDLVAQGRQALDAGRVDEALALFEKAVAADVKSAAALAWLGAAQVRKARAIGGIDAATWVKRGFDTLDEAVDRFPSAWIVYLQRGVASAQVPDMFRKAPGAVKDLGAVVAMKDRDGAAVPDAVMPLVYLNLGVAHRKNGQKMEARAAWEKGKRLYPGAPETQAIDKEPRGL
jgi:hypothetical protein